MEVLQNLPLLIVSEAFSINSNWTDVELASIPCSYSTAEGMLQKASAGKENILITGAAGGVRIQQCCFSWQI